MNCLCLEDVRHAEPSFSNRRRRYFRCSAGQVREALQKRSHPTDQQTDQMVYEFCGLTPEGLERAGGHLRELLAKISRPRIQPVHRLGLVAEV